MGESTPTAPVAIPHENVHDRFGAVHMCDPGEPKRGHAIYGDLSKPAFACGCQPIIHRFKCAACRRWVGWCFGGHSGHRFEDACCNDCVVALWNAEVPT